MFLKSPKRGPSNSNNATFGFIGSVGSPSFLNLESTGFKTPMTIFIPKSQYESETDMDIDIDNIGNIENKSLDKINRALFEQQISHRGPKKFPMSAVPPIQILQNWVDCHDYKCKPTIADKENLCLRTGWSQADVVCFIQKAQGIAFEKQSVDEAMTMLSATLVSSPKQQQQRQQHLLDKDDKEKFNEIGPLKIPISRKTSQTICVHTSASVPALVPVTNIPTASTSDVLQDKIVNHVKTLGSTVSDLMNIAFTDQRRDVKNSIILNLSRKKPAERTIYAS